MTNLQITIRLSPEKDAEFRQYAKSFGLSASGLLQLLIAREKHLRRLARSGSANGRPSDKHAADGPRRMPTVTAHLPTKEQLAEFDGYATACGLNRGEVGEWLLETELHERWLEKAIRMKTRL